MANPNSDNKKISKHTDNRQKKCYVIPIKSVSGTYNAYSYNIPS